jgi:hypothetical protein
MPRHAILASILTLTLLAACSSSDPTPSHTPDAEGGATGSSGATGAPPEEHLTRRDRTLEAIMNGEGDYVAVSEPRYLPTWEKLGAKDPDYVFDSRNPDGGHSPMLIADVEVDDEDHAWFQIYLPIRPNGSTGWVSEEDVRVQERTDRIEVDLSKRVLEHYRDGELVGRFKVGVGTDQYPTGTGTFYVWVRVPFENPNQPYGIFALGLSGFSPVLSDWPGEGRMAIHGTPYASNRGQAVSHGCVRVYNPDMESLVDVPLGTPVIISK